MAQEPRDMTVLSHPSNIMPRRDPAGDDELQTLWRHFTEAAEAYRRDMNRTTGAEMSLAYGAFLAALPDRDFDDAA